MSATTRLEFLTTEHARPLERFERANRTFFAARVGDRGDEYFEHFDDRLAIRAQENREGTSLYFVIVDPEGEVLGRVNISDVDRPDRTELGFRVAEHAQGRGLATTGVINALEIAATRGVRTVKARECPSPTWARVAFWNAAALPRRGGPRRRAAGRSPFSATPRTSTALWTSPVVSRVECRWSVGAQG